jgi:uncharacterized protein
MKKLIAILLLVLIANPVFAAENEKISWDQLMPEDWNPKKVFEDMSDEEFNALTDEQYNALEEQVQAAISAAPVVQGLDGKQVKIPGFIVPLEFDNTDLKEFFLVPYFGACTHTPPPPANQIVHGKLTQKFTVEDIYQPVWINGKINTVRVTRKLNEAGVVNALDIQSAYSMTVDSIEPYEE